VEELVAAYRAGLQAAGMFAGHPVTSVARSFFARVGADGWSRLPLDQQCALPLKDRRVAGWLIVTGRVRPSPDYLVACRPYLGEVAARHHRAFHEQFSATSAELGFSPVVTRLQWSALAKVAALAGLAPQQPPCSARRPPCSTSARSTRHPARPTGTALPSGPPRGRRSRPGWQPR